MVVLAVVRLAVRLAVLLAVLIAVLIAVLLFEGSLVVEEWGRCAQEGLYI